MKPFFKIGHSPEDLCFFIPVIGQGHDDVVIDLRNGISVAKSPQTFPVSVKDLLIGRRKMLLSQGRSVGPKLKLMDE